jgi:hypothetical protein
LSYNLRNALNIKWAKTVSITASARNILTITKYSGLDPESSSTGSDDVGLALDRGVDSFGFPNLKSYQFGVNIGF